jgi:hypothetical protein
VRILLILLIPCLSFAGNIELDVWKALDAWEVGTVLNQPLPDDPFLKTLARMAVNEEFHESDEYLPPAAPKVVPFLLANYRARPITGSSQVLFFKLVKGLIDDSAKDDIRHAAALALLEMDFSPTRDSNEAWVLYIHWLEDRYYFNKELDPEIYAIFRKLLERDHPESLTNPPPSSWRRVLNVCARFLARPVVRIPRRILLPHIEHLGSR